MLSTLKNRVDWATPIAPAYDYATLAVRLGHIGHEKRMPFYGIGAWIPFSRIGKVEGKRGGCLARKQGRCPGLEFCADCPWSENSR